MVTNEAIGVEGQLTPPADCETWLPGQGRRPAQRPLSSDGVAVLVHRMNRHVAIEQPGLDEINHLSVALNSPELRERILKINISAIKAVGLVDRKPFIVLAEASENIHD